MLRLEFMADIIHAQFILVWPDFVRSEKFICSFTEGATSSLDEKNLFFLFFSISPFFFFFLGYLGHNTQLCCTDACLGSHSDTTDGDL